VALYITSSRRPSIRTRTFIKELERVIPGSRRVVRGKKALEDLLELMIREGVSHLLIIDNVRGNPYSIRIYEAAPGLPKLLCRIYIKGVSLQVDVKRKRSISQLEIEDKCRSEESIRLAEVINAVIPETRYSSM
jgi:U3 small nucleolar ribonucleoprotein protein IMP4